MKTRTSEPAGVAAVGEQGVFDSTVRLAAQVETRRRLMAIWSRIEADKYLRETMRELAETMEESSPYWDMCCALAAYAELVKPQRYLEIGVRQGRSAAIVAAVCPDVDLYLFDMWHPAYAGVPNPGPGFVQAQLQRVGHRGGVHFGTGRSQETIPRFFADASQPDLFPLITVDGDHRDAGARRDLDNVIDHLAPGGMLAFDDISHPTYPTLHDTWRRFIADHPGLLVRENARDGTGTALAFQPRSVHD
jgi:predicted O-methyltransferase YrrM